MIAKRVLRGKAGDFGRLGEYITRGPHAGPRDQHSFALVGHAISVAAMREMAVWQRTADYILDAASGGARAAAVRISNCVATEVDTAIMEILATQGRNTRARGDRTYHLVVSFPPGEKPALEQLRDIEDELCKAIGLGKHQRLSVVHTHPASAYAHRHQSGAP